MSEDEARRDAHEELQEENARRLSNLQTAHRSVLLSCEALQGEQVLSAVLSEHQAEVASTESGSAVSFDRLRVAQHLLIKLFSL
jgi:hypothetical protein